jgi:hypothetical protein|nr:MAG TPA: hypothetical protein [Microviridae sp.]
MRKAGNVKTKYRFFIPKKRSTHVAYYIKYIYVSLLKNEARRMLN